MDYRKAPPQDSETRPATPGRRLPGLTDEERAAADAARKERAERSRDHFDRPELDVLTLPTVYTRALGDRGCAKCLTHE